MLEASERIEMNDSERERKRKIEELQTMELVRQHATQTRVNAALHAVSIQNASSRYAMAESRQGLKKEKRIPHRTREEMPTREKRMD